MMAYVFFNTTHGGFEWPETVREKYKEITGLELYRYDHDDQNRSDPLLVKLMFEAGLDAWGDVSVRKVKYGERYYIDEYDGKECVVTEADQEWATARNLYEASTTDG